MMAMLPMRLLGRGHPLGLVRGAGLLQRRLESTLTVHRPHESASREVPTPMLVLTAKSWTQGTLPKPVDVGPLVSHFTKHGWSVISLDLDPAHGTKGGQDHLLNSLTQEMTSKLGSQGPLPFPPLLVSTGLASLVAENYVSSHPLSGLVLLDPPLSPLKAHEANPEALPAPLDDFTYEPRFPTLVAWSRAELDRQSQAGVPWWEAHRIEILLEEEAGESLDRKVYDMADENSAALQIRTWAEQECGIGAAKEEGQAKMEEMEEVDEEEEEDGEVATASQRDAGILPEWFTSGNYQWNPSGSKKEPLLLDDKDLQEYFIRGSGPGGQAINKLSICVVLRHEPTGTKVRCQESRSRETNRGLARRLLSRKIDLLLRGPDSVEAQDQLRRKKKKLNKKKKMIKRRLDQGVVLRQKHREFLKEHDNDSE